MPHAVRFELLRKRPLLLHVSAATVAERLIHCSRAAHIDRVDPAEIDPGPVARVLEHRERLTAAEQHRLGALEPVPVEIGIRLARRQEEPVHLVDLGEMHRTRCLALVERIEPLAQGRLDDVGGAVLERRDRGHTGRCDRPLGLEPLLL